MKNEKRYWEYYILILACILVYYPIIGNKFLDFWDDQWVVMNSYTEGGFNRNNLWRILTEYYHGQYAPFNEYLYLGLHSLFGYNPIPFHAASLLLHIANACLAYTIFRQMLYRSGRMEFDTANKVSFLTALLFAVHPFNVESVAWMSASKILVYAFFYLLATYTYLQYLEKGTLRYYIGTLLLFICSFLGKEQAVTFPVWMLLINWLYCKDLKNKQMWLSILPFFILSLFFGVITMLSQSNVGQGILTNEHVHPLWQRLVYACYTFTEYVSKCFIPLKLSYLYPFPSLPGEQLPKWLLFYPLLLITILCTLWKYITHWQVFFALLFFGVHIGVALHIIPLSRFAVVADRYVYLSSLGCVFLIASGIIYCYKTYERKVIILFFLCYLLALSLYSNNRCHTWHDTDTLKYELRELLKHKI